MYFRFLKNHQFPKAFALFRNHFSKTGRGLLEGVVAGFIIGTVGEYISTSGEVAFSISLVFSTLGGMVIWGAVVFLWGLFRTPSILFYQQKAIAETFSLGGIEFIPHTPSEQDLTPAGIYIKNGKNEIISCEAKVTKIWHERTPVADTILPEGLAWFVKENLHFGSTEIPPKGERLIVLEHIETSTERSAIRLTVQMRGNPTEKQKRLANKKSIGLEFGGRLGVPIYEDEPYIIQIEFQFIVAGVNIEPIQKKFSIKIDGTNVVSQPI